MDAQLVRLAGTVLEVSGTFLLAVEAIKVRNFRFLRTRVLKVALRRINPAILFVNENSAHQERKESQDWLSVILTMLILVGLLIIYMFGQFVGFTPEDLWQTFSSLVPGPLWFDLIAALPAGWLLMFLACIVGLSTYSLVVIVLEGIIATLAFIEKQTTTGVIGMMGFLLFLIGASMKAYLDWSGA